MTSSMHCFPISNLVIMSYHLLVRYVEVSLAVEEELGQVAVEVPGPGPRPRVVHGADQSLLASQPPEIISPGKHTEVIRTRPHSLDKAHSVPHPRQPVDDAEDQALGDGHMGPRTRTTVPHEAAGVKRTVLEAGGYCQTLRPNNSQDIISFRRFLITWKLMHPVSDKQWMMTGVEAGLWPR